MKGYRNCWKKKHKESWASVTECPEALLKEDFTKQIDRESFASVAVKLYESISGRKASVISENPFTDTSNEHVLTAYALGITKGTSENTFSPNAKKTREEMAVMITRVLEKVGINVTAYPEAAVKFDDDAEFHDWGRNSIYFMSVSGIIKGVGNNKMNATGTAKAEEAVAIALRCAEKFGK